MNLSGTQIAKDAANIILLDDNFASIVTAVKWGRNVYDSISKFLQFQLTVNIVACTVSIVGVFVHRKPVIAAVQMLWVNLIMDSLASLALASEPPNKEVLKRQPVNRSASLLSRQMVYNMAGHAIYQITAMLLMYFEGPTWFDIPSGHGSGSSECGAGDVGSGYDGVDEDSANSTMGRMLAAGGSGGAGGAYPPSTHYTMIFTAFVMMTLFNELNCRKLKGEMNIFEGLSRNPAFCGIFCVTMLLQVLMTQFGSNFFKTEGLTAGQWGICIGFGAFSLPWQLVINAVAHATESDPRSSGPHPLVAHHAGDGVQISVMSEGARTGLLNASPVVPIVGVRANGDADGLGRSLDGSPSGTPRRVSLQSGHV